MRVTLLLLLAGCSGPVVGVYDYDRRDVGHVRLEIVEDACAMLEVDCTVIEPVDGDGDFDVLVYLSETTHEDGLAGEATGPLCSRDVHAQPLRQAVAHELGHVWGLNHSDSERNIMYPVVDESHTEVSFAQHFMIDQTVENQAMLCH